MENTFSSKYKKTYIQGYAFGLLPVFHDCEDMVAIAPHYNNDAFISGFQDGRFEYEKLNGSLSNGIPENIITEQVLAGFFLEGKLGMRLDAVGYTPHQTGIIRKYYESGYTYYQPLFDISLYRLMAKRGIDMN